MTEGVKASEARVKEKVYRMLVRPAMMHGLKTVAQTKRQAKGEVPKFKMLKIFTGSDMNGQDYKRLH